MEPDEIGVVLARASELHAKISDAIERAMKSEFLLSTGGRSPSAGVDSENTPSSPREALSGDGDKEYGSDLYEGGGLGPAVGDGNAEARSLGSIRDALEVLEEQLESLQAMQQQQRTEKDAALADLEESRRILLRRLKDHRGCELEVVHEALAFAGEPVAERDDLPLPPYPMPISDSSFVPSLEDESPPFRSTPLSLRGNGAVKKLTLGDSQDEENDELIELEEEEGEDADQEEGTSPQYETQRGKEDEGFWRLPTNILKISGSVFGHATKAALVVVSVIAFLAISQVGQGGHKRRAPPPYSVKKPSPIPPPRPKPAPLHECPFGKKLIMQDGYPKCVVKERVELPFPREVKTPDVLYGRG